MYVCVDPVSDLVEGIEMQDVEMQGVKVQDVDEMQGVKVQDVDDMQGVEMEDCKKPSLCHTFPTQLHQSHLHPHVIVPIILLSLHRG